jgi:hypothetical protein
VSLRGCPFCGKSISDVARECRYCHEYIPELRLNSASRVASGNATIHRGLWYMLILAAIYYVFSGQTPLKLKIPYQSIFLTDVLPVLFFVALGIVLYGVFLRVK